MSRVRVVYGAVVFLSAFLLFLVEPMAAKRLLPLLGGSSAVWVTCLVFFQAMLLVGYLYAHWMAREGSVRVHMLLLGAAVLVALAPVVLGLALGVMGVNIYLNASAAEHPVGTIFAALGITIGLPFLMLGSTSPLLQVWWARREAGAVPYRLFALSNVGSLLALLVYPVFVEPHMTLAQQRGWWATGFVVYAVVCGWLAKRAAASPTHRDEAAMSGTPGGVMVIDPTLRDAKNGAPGIAGSAGQRWMWFLLPAGAATQLAAVTAHLSQDIAAIPLLWILPLAVYLLTFILAFEVPHLYRRWVMMRVLLVMLASLGYALSKIDVRMPVGIAVAFYLVEIFISCWFCHAEVYRLRPSTARESTTFYLLVAAGGVAGTFFVAIASPIMFRANYDLALAFVTTAALAAIVTWNEGRMQRILWCTATGLLLALTIALRVQFGRSAIMRARNFYGSLRVTEAGYDDAGLGEGGAASTGTGPVRVLMNGRIRHGMQMLDADKRDVPTTYYGQNSGVGVTLHECCEGRTKRIGVIGLGVGTIAAYGQTGDTIRFYEINPLVEPIGRNLFTFLRDSKASVSVVTGDGRMALSSEPPQNFDVLVVDAFTGDAIPLHLLTREAMELYKRQTTPGGVIAFHVSNSYLNLAPEIGRVAEAEGLQARVVESFEVPAEGAYRATWVLVSANADFFARPGVRAASRAIPPQPGLRVWTDDYSSLWPVLKLGR